VPSEVAAGLTVADVARRYRVGPDKVRAWIARGELAAIDTAAVRCGRPRWVITPEALAAFERARTGGPATQQVPRRRRRLQAVDYFAD
jgi:transposase